MKCLTFNLALFAVLFSTTSAASTPSPDEYSFQGSNHSAMAMNSTHTHQLENTNNIIEQLSQIIAEKKSAKIEAEINAKLEKYLSKS